MLPEPPDTDIKERGQIAGPRLIRTHLSLPSWWPTLPLITLGPGPMFFIHHHTTRQVLLLAPFDRRNRLKRAITVLPSAEARV